MKKMLKNTLVCLALTGGLSAAYACDVDTSSVEGIFNALTTSSNLQATVDNLVAGGAHPQDIVSVAAAAGIPLDTVKELQVCVNSSSNTNVLGASCMKQRSMATAYAAGTNDPVKYLPATAAGKHQHKDTNKDSK